MNEFNQHDKPFRTIAEQIEILKSRNLDVDTLNSIETAERILSNYSYYTIVNGYKQNLMINETRYKDNVSLHQLKDLYYLDTTLNAIILKHILIFERKLKTKMAYLIGGEIGVDADWRSQYPTQDSNDYLCPLHYTNNNNSRSSTISKIKTKIKEIDGSSRRKCTTKYYLDNKNHLPPWILVNDLALGTTIEWFRILKKDHKTSIIKQFFSSSKLLEEESINLFTNILIYLRDFRNITAHGNRNLPEMISSFENINLLRKFYNDFSIPNDNKKQITLLFLALIAVTNDKSSWMLLVEDIEIFCKINEKLTIADISVLSLLGLPDNSPVMLLELAKIKIQNNSTEGTP